MSERSPSIALTDADQLFMLDNQARHFAPSALSFYRARLGNYITWCDTQGLQTLYA